MAPVIRESDVKASPETIWKTCFVPMQWQEWDVDVERMENVSGGVENGTTFDFVMKSGPQKVPITLSDVVVHKTLRFSGSMVGGLVKFDGFIEITDKSSSDSVSTSTHVKYTFALSGLLGHVAVLLNKKPVVEGTEVGLKNIVEMSEKAEQQ